MTRIVHISPLFGDALNCMPYVSLIHCLHTFILYFWFTQLVFGGMYHHCIVVCFESWTFVFLFVWKNQRSIFESHLMLRDQNLLSSPVHYSGLLGPNTCTSTQCVRWITVARHSNQVVHPLLNQIKSFHHAVLKHFGCTGTVLYSYCSLTVLHVTRSGETISHRWQAKKLIGNPPK